jgi:hypothetical protein
LIASILVLFVDLVESFLGQLVSGVLEMHIPYSLLSDGWADNAGGVAAMCSACSCCANVVIVV